ncbi:hypothetical protein N9X46_00970 [Paracoccaceae bacterium]|nr:hypothetical protein [Paracoccaceae bacterium]
MPTLITENKAMYPNFVSIHLASSILLLTPLLQHMGTALFHNYMIKDHLNMWKRMALQVRCD